MQYILEMQINNTLLLFICNIVPKMWSVLLFSVSVD